RLKPGSQACGDGGGRLTSHYGMGVRHRFTRIGEIAIVVFIVAESDGDLVVFLAIQIPHLPDIGRGVAALHENSRLVDVESADHHVGASATIDDIASVSAVKIVVAFATEELVVARAAMDDVIPGAAVDEIIAGF